MKFKNEVEVRFADLDAYGHVNHAIYFTYLETARTNFFKNKFLELYENGINFIITKVSCEYKAPIMLSDTVFVEMEITNVRRTRFDVDYVLNNGEDKIFAYAKTTLVTFDKNKNKPVKIPENFLT
jgi:acyl-CoA thioester hydrolase